MYYCNNLRWNLTNKIKRFFFKKWVNPRINSQCQLMQGAFYVNNGKGETRNFLKKKMIFLVSLTNELQPTPCEKMKFKVS